MHLYILCICIAALHSHVEFLHFMRICSLFGLQLDELLVLVSVLGVGFVCLFVYFLPLATKKMHIKCTFCQATNTL